MLRLYYSYMLLRQDGFSALVVFSSVAARFFTPQLAPLNVNPAFPVQRWEASRTGALGFAGTTVEGDLVHVFKVGSAAPPITCSAPGIAGVHVCSRIANATVTSPVAISAAANGGMNHYRHEGVHRW